MEGRELPIIGRVASAGCGESGNKAGQDVFVDMKRRRLFSTDFGNRESKIFINRKSGAVYKVFELDDKKNVGTRFEINADGKLDIGQGRLTDLFEKIYIINAIGGTPTEIIGQTEDGRIIVKQPYGGGAGKIGIGERQGAEQTHGLVFVPNTVVAGIYRIFYTNVDGQGFLIGDLHPGNFHRDTFKRARILDISTAKITDEYYKAFPQLKAFEEANRERAKATGAMQFSTGTEEVAERAGEIGAMR